MLLPHMKGAVLNFQELDGKSLALLLAGQDDDWSVMRGIVRHEGEALLLDHSESEQPLVLQAEWLERIKLTPAELSATFMHAEFFLPLSVGALPEDADPSDYIHTGLKLPE